MVEAGAIANGVLARPEIETRMKSDRSPVSEADERVEEFLMEALERELPGVARIAEEAAARGETPLHGDAFLLIDPIDGTREFIGRSPEFTVNLALVDKIAPVAGAIFAPVGARVWFAGAQGFTTKAVGGGALPPAQDWSALRVRPQPTHGLTALADARRLDAERRAAIGHLVARVDASLRLRQRHELDGKLGEVGEILHQAKGRGSDELETASALEVTHDQQAARGELQRPERATWCLQRPG